MTEIWKDIPGYEGIYQVSNLGRLKSLPRDVPFGDLGTIRCEERVRKLQTNRDGFLMVGLKKDGHIKSCSVSALVMHAFMGPPEESSIVKYKDGDRKNVHLDNLYYESRKAVGADLARRHQRLTDTEVKAIRERLQSGEKGSALAKEFRGDPSTISLIKNNKRFRWLK